jgi:hypothetical protein
MRDTVGYKPRRRRPWRPQDSFAYAGGDIRLLSSVPDPSAAPPPPLPAQPAQPTAPPAPQEEHTMATTHTDSPDIPQPPQTAVIQHQPPIPEPQEPLCRSDRGRHPERPAGAEGPPPRAPRKPRRPSRIIEINPNRHRAHCTICNHPERDAIEQAFLHWWRTSAIVYQFKLPNRLVLYRHAQALRLFERRKARTEHALGYIVEKADYVEPTADSVIRALGCIDDNGRWAEPRKHVVVTHEIVHSNSDAPARRGAGNAANRPRLRPFQPLTSNLQPPALVDTHVELETGLIPSAPTTWQKLTRYTFARFRRSRKTK